MDRLNRAGHPPSYPRLFLFLVAFSLAGSLLSRVAHLDPGPIAPVTSLLTLAAGIVATFGEYVCRVSRPARRLTLALLLGAGTEIVGLTTGFPFGPYRYTGVWWPSFSLPSGPFPLPLPFAWLMMAGAALLSLPRWKKANWILAAACGGLLAAGIDLVMEPVLAGPLHYWRWLEPGPLPGGAPIANFLGWWATGTGAGLILSFKTPELDPRRPRWVIVGFLTLIVGLGLIS